MSSLFAPVAIGMPGPFEMLIIAGVALIIFGPKRLPELARSIGESFTSFKEGLKGNNHEAEGPANLPPAARKASIDAPPVQQATASKAEPATASNDAKPAATES